MVSVGLVALSAIVSGADTASRSWSTFQGSSSHDGYVHVTLNPRHFGPLWQKTVCFGHGHSLNPMIAENGRVFVSEVGYFVQPLCLSALDAATGETLWTVDVGPVSSMGAPAAGYGNIYVQTVNPGFDTYLSAYDQATGALAFRSAHPAQFDRYNSPTVFDGTVYVNAGTYGGLSAFDAFRGQQLWAAGLPQYDMWSPAVDQRRAFAYAGGGEFYSGLFVLDRATGVELERISDPDFSAAAPRTYTAPVLGDQNDVIAINAGRLISFSLSPARIRWQTQGEFHGQPVLARKLIYGIGAGRLSVRREDDGQEVWTWAPPEGTLIGNPLVTDSHVFVQTPATLYAVDTRTRGVAWSYPLNNGSAILGMHLAYADGRLFVGEGDFIMAFWLGPGRSGFAPNH